MPPKPTKTRATTAKVSLTIEQLLDPVDQLSDDDCRKLAAKLEKRGVAVRFRSVLTKLKGAKLDECTIRATTEKVRSGSVQGWGKLPPPFRAQRVSTICTPPLLADRAFQFFEPSLEKLLELFNFQQEGHPDPIFRRAATFLPCPSPPKPTQPPPTSKLSSTSKRAKPCATIAAR